MKILNILIPIVSIMCISCGNEEPTDHTKKIAGVSHREELATASDSCMNCHGSNLEGTMVAPSCYSCHGDLWNDMNESDILSTIGD